MKVNRQLWLLAGGDGAGKSTFYRTRLEPLDIPFVNADLIARELYPDSPEAHSYDAAMIAEQKRNALLEEGRSFCFETVFSHSSKIDFVGRAKALGYQVILIFIHLESAALNQARVYQRVEEGGHDVPPDKIQSRIPRLLANIRVAIPLCDQVRLLDNSRIDDPFRVVAFLRNGGIEFTEERLEAWARKLLAL